MTSVLKYIEEIASEVNLRRQNYSSPTEEWKYKILGGVCEEWSQDVTPWTCPSWNVFIYQEKVDIDHIHLLPIFIVCQ